MFKKIAVRAAKEAAKIHMKYFNTKLSIKTKTGYYDRVTIADTKSEKKIISILKKHYPTHNFLAEEDTYKKTDSPYTWIIDPLDGTNNFSHGIPIFCVSIALVHKGTLILGVVYDPTRKELFVAEKGKGATLNGKKIKVSPSTTFKESIMVTGFYYERGTSMLRTLYDIKKFFKKGLIGVRRLGSAALDLCYVASGRFDGFWECKLSSWDYAAGSLILEEAGGKVTDEKGKSILFETTYVVGSNKLLHKKMLSLLN